MSEAFPDARPAPQQSSDLQFAKRALIGASVTLAVLACFVVVVYASSVIASLFVAVLLALGLRGLGGWIAERTPLGSTMSMIALLLGLVGAGLGFGVGVAPSLTRQVEQMATQLPQQLQQVEQQLRGSPLGGRLLGPAKQGGSSQQGQAAPSQGQAASGQAPGPAAGQGSVQGAPSGSAQPPAGQGAEVGQLAEGGVVGSVLSKVTASGGVVSTVARAASGALAAVAAVALVVVAALYLAFRPRPYLQGFLALLPTRARGEAASLLGEMTHKLRWWLLGQVTAMVLIGALTGIGLAVVGVEMALALAVLAGLLNFIPNFGPVLSLVPALLFSSGHVVEVLIIYGSAQFLESYVVTPNIQRAAVKLEPVVLIGGQVLMGVMFGAPGLIVAAPLLVVADVLLRRVWRENTLQDPSASAAPGAGPQPAAGGVA